MYNIVFWILKHEKVQHKKQQLYSTKITFIPFIWEHVPRHARNKASSIKHQKIFLFKQAKSDAWANLIAEKSFLFNGAH